MKVIQYKSSSIEYSIEVEKTKYYCPNCGKKKVYEQTGEGDFYEGTSLHCIECKFSFSMPSRSIDNNITIEP